MTTEENSDPGPADVAIAVAVFGVRTGLRAGGAVIGILRPFARTVGALCADRPYVRELAETGARYRRAAVETATRHYLAAVRTVAHDAVEQLDLPRLVHETSDAVVSDTRRGIRTQAVNADQRVSRWFANPRPRADPH